MEAIIVLLDETGTGHNLPESNVNLTQVASNSYS